MAGRYAGTEKEIETARTGLSLADLSSLGKFSMRGMGVQGLMQPIFGESLPGKAVSLKDKLGWACCLTPDHCLLLSAKPQDLARDALQEFVANLRECQAEMVYDDNSAYAVFGLFGPRWEEILREITALDPVSLLPGTCAQTGLAGVHAILVRLPDPWTGLLILVAWDVAEFAWERFWEIGGDKGMKPLGLEGVEVLFSTHQ